MSTANTHPSASANSSLYIPGRKSKKEAMSGFVYIWHDLKHDRWYIGSHWGNPDDGYICSSWWMKNAYRRRPEDFRRRILTPVTESKTALLKEEQRWLRMIPDNELGQKYYNLIKSADHLWHQDSSKKKSVAQKVSAANSGRVAVYNPITGEERRVDPDEADLLLANDGWVFGRNPDVYSAIAVGWKKRNGKPREYHLTPEEQATLSAHRSATVKARHASNREPIESIHARYSPYLLANPPTWGWQERMAAHFNVARHRLRNDLNCLREASLFQQAEAPPEVQPKYRRSDEWKAKMATKTRARWKTRRATGHRGPLSGKDQVNDDQREAA